MTVGTDVKNCYLTIKSAEASLQALSLSSTSEEHKQVYEQTRKQLEAIQQELHDQVLFLARVEPQYK